MLTLTLTTMDLAALTRGERPDLAVEIAREHARRMDEVEALRARGWRVCVQCGTAHRGGRVAC